MLQEILMPSNHAFASKIRPGSGRCAVSGHDVPTEDIDGAFTANRKLTLVPRSDLTSSSARESPSIVAESAEETDGSPLASWSAVFTALMEGFVLYGASLHPNAFFPIGLFRANHNAFQLGKRFPLRGPGAVVSYSVKPGEAVPHLERATNRNMSGETGVASVDTGFFGSEGVTSVGIVRSSARSCWNLIAGLWTYWRS
jgi:hypothetical protein